ncbi:MAG: hypothetical protein ACI86M_003299 [Saprospiraceae bacterium]|jgi:hypothetical protein
MDSEKKIEYANRIAKQLEGQRTTDEVRYELKSDGVDDQVIIEIMITTRNILANKYLPKIREYLIKDKEIHGSKDFLFLEDSILNTLKKRELQNLADFEMNKIAKLLKNNMSGEEILDQVDTRFLSLDIAVSYINGLEEVKGRSKADESGFFLISRGFRLILLLGILFYSGKFSYSILILGLYFLYWLFTRKDTQYYS